MKAQKRFYIQSLATGKVRETVFAANFKEVENYGFNKGLNMYDDYNVRDADQEDAHSMKCNRMSTINH